MTHLITGLVPDMVEVQRKLLRREAQNPGRPKKQFNIDMRFKLMMMDVDEVIQVGKEVPKMKLHYCLTYFTIHVEPQRGYTLKVIPGIGYKIWRWK